MPDSELKERLEAELESLRAECSTVTYRDLAKRLDMTGGQSIHRLTTLLEETMREDHATGRPLRAALVVSRTTGNLPQRGFFQLLRQLGRYNGSEQGAEAQAVHQQELARLWDNQTSGQEGTRE
ncbi:MAG: hypothetical protein ACQETX_12690 [Pseudomonadota bacterium]